MESIAIDRKATWAKRWFFMRRGIRSAIEKMRNKNSNLTDQRNIIEILEHSLKFSDTLFTFFFEGYYGDDPVDFYQHEFVHEELKATLDRLKNQHNFFSEEGLPAEIAFDLLLTRVSNDFFPLYHAFNFHDEADPLSDWRPQFHLAASLAKRSNKILQAIGTLGEQFNDISVHIYCSDKIKIRVVPYANAMLIGFPISSYMFTVDDSFNLSSDYLALSHETGHYVYNFGYVSNPKSTGQQLPLRAEEFFLQGVYEKFEGEERLWLSGWLEEIFADTYGIMVDGPVAAVGFQQMLIDNHYDEIDMFDTDHPIAGLRPLIQANVLDSIADHQEGQMAKTIYQIAENLRQLWRRSLQNNWQNRGHSHPEEMNFNFGRAGNMQGSDILNKIKIVTQFIVENLIIAGFNVEGSAWQSIQNVELSDPETTINNLYTEYEKAGYQYFNDDRDSSALKLEIPLLPHIRNANSVDELVKLLLIKGWGDEGGENDAI